MESKRTEIYTEEELNNSCLSCKHFVSFQEEYFDDHYESDEQGTCRNVKSKYYGNECAGECLKCDFYEKDDSIVANP